MNRIKSLTKLTCTVLLLLSVAGCEDFVTVDLPEHQLTGTSIFEDGNTATAALMDVYSSIRDEGLLSGGGSSFELGIYSDELDLFGANNLNNGEFYQHSVQSANFTIENWWDAAFLQIYQLNALMEGMAASNKITQTVKDQLSGEAIFLRSLIFFYAANIWRDIPYIATSDYRINSMVSRDEWDWVLEQISTDLDMAISLLPEEYPSNDRTRVNRYTAMALQARLFLYQGQWEKLEEITSDILSTTSVYQWEEDLHQIFKIGSTSTIWQLQAGPSGRNTREASSFIINSTPPVIAALSHSLYASFEMGDRRLNQWIGNITDEDTGTVYHFPYKYKAPYLGTTSVEYSKVFRLAEVYLMRAEAYANLGNTIGSLADLNRVRQRAGLPALDTSSANLILDAIVEERRHELFTEYGHRWFDLRRLGLAEEVLSPIKPGWKDTNNWFPIPEKELIANPNLQPQNNGY